MPGFHIPCLRHWSSGPPDNAAIEDGSHLRRSGTITTRSGRRIASQAFRNHHHAKRPTNRISGAPEPSPSREAAELESPARECRVAFPSHARVPTGTAPVRASFAADILGANSAAAESTFDDIHSDRGAPRLTAFASVA